MSLIIAIVVTALATLSFVAVLVASLKAKINATAFMAQIQKLVMANNIDRAIKLCNVVPGALLPKAAKTLLIHSNQPHVLELAFQEAAYPIRKAEGGTIRVLGGLVLNILLYTALGVALYFDSVMNRGPSVVVGVLMAVTVFFVLSTQGLAASINAHRGECLLHLIKLRNLLFNRGQDYVPPQMQPRPLHSLTKDELEAWRAAMDDFNERMGMRRKAGEAIDVLQSYDAESNTDGVLPPV